jgi:hypothetical protein
MDIRRMRSGSTDNLRQLPELGKTDNAKLLGFHANGALRLASWDLGFEIVGTRLSRSNTRGTASQVPASCFKLFR